MTAVNIIDTTIEQVFFEVSDSRGRKIKLKKPNLLAQFRMIEALGTAANNEVYTSMVMPLIYVTEIDGQAEMPPTTKREVEALLQRLDHEGMIAVMTGIREHFSKNDEQETSVAKK